MTQEQVLDKLTTDIHLRGLSDNTVIEYRDKARVFMRHFGKSADEMGEAEFRISLEYLDREGRLVPGSINTYNSALRFLFEVTLEQNLNYKRLPRKKDPIKIPPTLMKEEISKFLNAIDDLRYKTIFSILYGSGLRISEVQTLRIQDIDSKQMRIFIYQAKGKKDRYVPLANACLLLLREYFKKYHPKHVDGYLFLNQKADKHISDRAIQDAFKKYHNMSEIKTKATVHTLRHSFATHLFEDGINIFFIQKLLGHATISSTMRYLRIAQTDVLKTHSPLDTIMGMVTDHA